MLITNLPHIAGYDIEVTHGMVSTTVALTRRVMKTSMGGARGAHESGCDGFSVELEAARKKAFSQLEAQAEGLSASAVIGVNEQLHRIGDTGFMLMLTGTAVDLVKAAPVAAAAPQAAPQLQIVYVQAEATEYPEPEIVEATVRDNVIYPQFARA
jgi:uncharacterized protein YbjQ (UPF0145 family)